MKKITLSAGEDLIEKARSVARAQHRTLSAAFREWLEQYSAGEGDTQSFNALMRDLSYVNSYRHFSRVGYFERSPIMLFAPQANSASHPSRKLSHRSRKIAVLTGSGNLSRNSATAPIRRISRRTAFEFIIHRTVLNQTRPQAISA
jgi:hypothetical protein